MIASGKVFVALFALFSTTALTPWSARAQDAAPNPRIALVIGNATYRDKALATTANDAGLVAQTLQAAGFEVVGARDLDEKSLRTAMRDFLEKAAAAGPEMQAFVYLSGRGLQYDGDNYFVPVDAQINRDADVPIDSLRISDFAHALAATPGKARMIVLDAARANPYAAQGSPLAPGLALVDPEPGELMAFNAAPGTLAGDEEGPYGVYGKTLAGAMRQGGVDIADVFNQVRVTVNQQTQGALIPWSASKLGGPYYVFERAADAPAPPVATEPENRPIASLPPADAYNEALLLDTMQGYEQYLAAFPNSDQARRVRAILAARREAAFWRRSVGANSPHAYWTYLRRYPHGPHVADARRRLAILSARFEPPPDFQPMVYEDLPPPPPDEAFYESRPYYAFDDFGPPPPPPPVGFYYNEDADWRDLPPPPPPQEIGVLPVLGIAIPLVAGAIAYHHFHKDGSGSGVAPAGAASVVPPRSFAPPPLPANIKPPQPIAPIPVATVPAGEKTVKPLPPIGPVGERAPAVPPAAPAAGKVPVAPPPTAPALVAPVNPPAGAPKPAAAPPTPLVTPTAPAGKVPAAPAVVPGAKPLPVAPAPVVVAPVNPPAGAPKPAVAPPTPLVTPTAPVGKVPAAPAAVPGAKPLPVAPAPALVAPVNPPAAAPKAPAALPTPTPIAPKQSLPSAVVPKAPVAPALAPQPPAVRVPATPPPAAPAAPAAPVIHTAPPAAPVYHAPPPPAPVYHAPPPPAPVYHAPPPPAPAARAPVCGKPGLPPCPK